MFSCITSPINFVTSYLVNNLGVFNNLIEHEVSDNSHSNAGNQTSNNSSNALTIRDFSWEFYDPTKEFSSVQVIDENVWKRVFSSETLTQHGLTFDDVDLLDGSALHTYLNGFDFSQIEGKGTNTGITILTLPKGLTFNKLLALAGSPQEESKAMKFRYDWVPQEHKNIAIEKTYRIAITNNILKGSREKTLVELKQMVEEKGGKMPGLLSVTTLAVLKFMSTPSGQSAIRLFKSNCTFCVQNSHPFVVGGFSSEGLSIIDRKQSGSHLIFGPAASGVALMREI